MTLRPGVKSIGRPTLGLWASAALLWAGCRGQGPQGPGEATTGAEAPAPERAKDRVIVLVVPGVDADLVERWRSDLPGLERLIPGRAVVRLQADGPATPAHTAAQLSTGMRGGAHGRLGGAWLDPSTLSLVPAARVEQGGSARPFWELAAEGGVPTRALWVPGALPATPVDGLTVLPASVPADRPDSAMWLRSEGASVPAADALSVTATLAGQGPWSVEVPLAGGATWPLAVSQPSAGTWRVAADGVQADVRAGELGPPVSFTLPSAVGGGAFLARVAAAPMGEGFVLGLLAPGRVATPGAPVTSPDSFADTWARAHGPVDTTGGVGALLDALRAGVVQPEAFTRGLQEQSQARGAALVEELERGDARLVVAWLPEAGVGAEAFLGLGDSGHPAWTSDRAARYGGAAKTAVVHLDATVKAVREGLQPGDRLLVVSDHGMASVRTLVDLNAALADAGLLALRDPARRDPAPALGTDIAWSRTVAYATGAGLVYLNRAGHHREGIVAAPRLARELARVTSALQGLKEGKRPVVAQVVPGDVAFPEAPAATRPDLVVRFADGFGPAPAMVHGRVGPRTIIPNTSMVTGGYDPADAPTAAGFAVTNFGPPDAGGHLADVGPTVLRLLGLPADGGMSGRAWTSAGEAVPTP
ncbi:alkaline phosphatase family protein [Myxococcota bacterium]|nr:alkaline phosphatase family protein [Myxococcota bacterium]